MRAVTVRSGTKDYLGIQEVPRPEAGPQAVLVRVKAFSLNRGEVNRAATRGVDGARPGSDFAGIVEHAPEGSGFAPGDRVAGMVLTGSWAEYVAASPAMMGRMPDTLGFEQAAAVPLAGLTAVYAMEKKPIGPGTRVLISGVTGGVGPLAVQLASQAGAHVTAYVRHEKHADTLRKLGAHGVATTFEQAAAGAPYDWVFDLIGGEFLGHALGWLASRGMCVLAGNASGSMASFDTMAFRTREGQPYGGTTLYGFYLGEELQHGAPRGRIEALLARVAAGTLDPMIGFTGSWQQTLQAADGLLSRGFSGKAVLTID